jgi:hypothetical protein
MYAKTCTLVIKIIFTLLNKYIIFIVSQCSGYEESKIDIRNDLSYANCTTASITEDLLSNDVTTDGEICYAYFDKDLLNKIRQNMPIQAHRRPDVI